MCSVPPVHQDLYNDMRAQFPELPDALIQSCVQLYARNRSQCIEHLTRASQEQLYSQFDSEEASVNREGLRPAVSPRLFEPLEPPFPPDQDLPPPYPGVLAPVLAPASPQSPPMVQHQRSRVDPQTPPHLPSPRLDQPPPRTDFRSQVCFGGCGIVVLHHLVRSLQQPLRSLCKGALNNRMLAPYSAQFATPSPCAILLSDFFYTMFMLHRKSFCGWGLLFFMHFQ